MTILVTGATGNVGRQVVAGLVRSGRAVRAMTRTPDTARMPDGVEVVPGDFERPETWRTALDGVRSVYLFPFLYAATDHGFLDEAVKAWATRFVVHSAAAAGFAPGTGGDGALGWHLGEEREALLTDDHLGAAYTLTGPVKVSQAEQVAAIGTHVRFEELGPAEARARWLRDGFDEQTADWMLALLADSVDGTGVLPPTDTYQRLTGRPPRTFARWANDHAADFRPGVAR